MLLLGCTQPTNLKHKLNSNCQGQNGENRTVYTLLFIVFQRHERNEENPTASGCIFLNWGLECYYDRGKRTQKIYRDLF